MTHFYVPRSRLTGALSTRPDRAPPHGRVTVGAPTGLVRQIGFALAPTLAGPSHRDWP